MTISVTGSASSGFGPTSGGNTRTLSHAATGANAASAIVVISDTSLVTGLAWSSGTITPRQSYNIGSAGYIQVYSVSSPPSSPANIVASFAGVQSNTCILIVDIAPDSGNSIAYRSSNKATDNGGSSPSIDLVLTTVAGDICIVFGATSYGGSSGAIDFDASSGSTVQVESEDGAYTGAAAATKTASGTSTTLGLSLTADGGSWDILGIAFEEVAGGGGGSSGNPMNYYAQMRRQAA